MCSQNPYIPSSSKHAARAPGERGLIQLTVTTAPIPKTPGDCSDAVHEAAPRRGTARTARSFGIKEGSTVGQLVAQVDARTREQRERETAPITRRRRRLQGSICSHVL